MTAWLSSRSPRERVLLGVAAALTAVFGLLSLVLAARDDLAALRARVAGHERELLEVRQLAARLQQASPPPAAADGATMLARLEAAAGATVGRDRIAALTPDADDRVTLQVSGAPLGSIVALLHTLEGATPRAQVARLDLRKEPDDPNRFDATLQVLR
jgi:type II secretory pathway component PulM